MRSPHVPILVIAYCRPKALSTLLSHLELEGKRNVYISIDGLRQDAAIPEVSGWKKCIAIANDWALESKHAVEVIAHRENLGLYFHFSTILKSFFSANPVGIVLEDDIGFVSEFIEFVDAHQNALTKGDYWSIQGNNPLPRNDLIEAPKIAHINFRETYIHTISGWASSRTNVELFLKFLHKEFPINESLNAIKTAARKITSDPLFQVGFMATWRRKMLRARNLGMEGSWDNAWEIAGWHSGLKSLMPNYSLSREIADQSEGQSHPHQTLGAEWSDLNLPEEIIVGDMIRSYSARADRALLRIWGIRRRYCWARGFQLTREYRSRIQGV